jgi:hypothetical protein
MNYTSSSFSRYLDRARVMMLSISAKASVVTTIMTMTAIPMSLNQVTSSGACARANQCAFLSAEQSARD